MAGCTRGLIPSVLMLFALLVGDELVTLVTRTVAKGKSIRPCTYRHDRVYYRPYPINSSPDVIRLVGER